VICAYLIGTAVLMVFFGLWTDPIVILVMFGLIGFGMQGGFVGLYAVSARLYPTEIRNTGIGWGIGAGRIGAVVGPKLGGVLVGMGLTLTTNFMIFALPVMVAGLSTLMVRNRGDS
jgi:MFS family permease